MDTIEFARAEYDIVRSYFANARRSPASDQSWLVRQCHKQLFDGVLQRVSSLQESNPLDALAPGGIDLDVATRREVAHFLGFADAYRVACGPDAEPLPVADVLGAGWSANRVLSETRRRHREVYGSVGTLAHTLTAGGFCALALAGSELDGRSVVDKAIMRACEIALEDGRHQVAAALGAVERADLDRTARRLLNELVRTQCTLRLAMRREQFSV